MMPALALAIVVAVVPSRHIAITFDDAPRPETIALSGTERAEGILSALRLHDVEATFFVNTERLVGNGRRRLERYAEAGHRIANHTHSHPDANALRAVDFIGDIERAHRILEPLAGFWPGFRFPYLREGDTLQKRDAIADALVRLGYTNAYITVNNYDWAMDRILQQAIEMGRRIDEEKFRDIYVEILVACVEYYDAMAQRLLGRSPKHVLLLHENDLNALFVADLLQALHHQGWGFISLEEAYADPIAQHRAAEPLRYNPGRIGEMAAAADFSPQGLWHESCDEDYLARRYEDALSDVSGH